MRLELALCDLVERHVCWEVEARVARSRVLPVGGLAGRTLHRVVCVKIGSLLSGASFRIGALDL